MLTSAARGGWHFRKCIAIQDDIPISMARTSTAGTRSLRDKFDALHPRVHHIADSHRSAGGQCPGEVNIGDQASWLYSGAPVAQA
jgi:hypothetical protein